MLTNNLLDFNKNKLKAFEAAIDDFQQSVKDLQKSKKSLRGSVLGTPASTITAQSAVAKHYLKVQESFAEMVANMKPKHRPQRLGKMATSNKIWYVSSQKMAKSVTNKLSLIKYVQPKVWFIGGTLTAIEAFQQGDSAPKVGTKVGASVAAGGAGYGLVSVGLFALGITPVGWVGFIGVSILSAGAAHFINSQFEATIDRYMD